MFDKKFSHKQRTHNASGRFCSTFEIVFPFEKRECRIRQRTKNDATTTSHTINATRIVCAPFKAHAKQNSSELLVGVAMERVLPKWDKGLPLKTATTLSPLSLCSSVFSGKIKTLKLLKCVCVKKMRYRNRVQSECTSSSSSSSSCSVKQNRTNKKQT